MIELPFVLAQRGIVNAKAAQEFANAHINDEVKDVKLLASGRTTPDDPCEPAGRTMEDLKGLKLRNPTRLSGEALKALGATSVGMPIPQVPESLAQKVIDGCVVPWEVVPAVRCTSWSGIHTEIIGSPTLYTTSFFLAMNKAKYDGLPPELRSVLDRTRVRRSPSSPAPCGTTRRSVSVRWWPSAATRSSPWPLTKGRDG